MLVLIGCCLCSVVCLGCFVVLVCGCLFGLRMGLWVGNCLVCFWFLRCRCSVVVGFMFMWVDCLRLLWRLVMCLM